MLPSLTWPDAALVVVTGLRDALTTDVGVRLPVPLTLPFVRVQRVGGLGDQTHDRARVLVECWAAREDETAALTASTRDALRGLVGTVDGWTVSRVAEIAGPASVTDPVTDTPRQLLTVEVTIRAESRP